VLARVNEVLAADFAVCDMFATLFFARCLPDGRRLVWSNAGHNPPLVLRRNGEEERLGPCGPPLGLVAGARWRDVDLRFEPGDVLLLYTDGLIEARDPAKRFFGTERLVDAARRPAGSAAAIRQNILEALARHVATEPVQDDVTLVVVRAVAIEERA
jgi:sigma-B regulation protein RsbU (phosphoserine phosphatase)